MFWRTCLASNDEDKKLVWWSAVKLPKWLRMVPKCSLIEFGSIREQQERLKMIQARKTISCFGFWEVSMTPKTNYLYLWKHQDTSNNSWRNPESFSKSTIWGNLTFLEIVNFENLAGRQILKIRLIDSSEILKMGSLSYKQTWNGNVVLNMKAISIKKHEMEVLFWLWDQYLPENMKWEFCDFSVQET